MSVTKPRSIMTVDREQFKSWVGGKLIDMIGGSCMIVNESECIAANNALQRGETVLFRNGAELTGTAVKLIDGAYQEVT